MSWAGLVSNQTVSFNNLQNAVNTGVFTAKTTIPVSNEQITKADANNLVNIDTTFGPYAAKASNQLVVKSNLQSVGSVGLVQFISSSTRTCQLRLFSDGVRIDDNQLFGLSESCSFASKTRLVNPITIPGVVVQILFGLAPVPETYSYTFRILNNPGRTTVFANISGTILVPTGGETINLRPPLLTVGGNYYYELVSVSTICPV